MKNNETACREAFESAFEEITSYSAGTYSDKVNAYEDNDEQIAWQLWQRAIRTPLLTHAENLKLLTQPAG